MVALDFITKLPLLKEPLIGISYDSILVIIDSLTKFTYLKLYKEVSTIEDLAYIFNKVVITRPRTLQLLPVSGLVCQARYNSSLDWLGLILFS